MNIKHSELNRYKNIKGGEDAVDTFSLMFISWE